LFDSDLEKACSMAVNYLSRYYKTKNELDAYLTKKKVSKDIIKQVIVKCEEYGYLNDEKYALSYCEFKKSSRSSRQIKFDLGRKGVDQKIIEHLEFDDRAAVKNLADKYMAKKEKTKENTLKLKNFLARKGFKFDDINSVVGENNENWD